MDKVKVFDANNFNQEVLCAQEPVLVDIWAPWCAPCNAMTPVVAQVAEEFTVGKLNLEENMELCKQYEVSAIPTFLFFKNGMVANRRMGMQSAEDLKVIMQKLSESGNLEG